MANANNISNQEATKNIIYVEREIYTNKKGAQHFSYFIKGNILGVDAKIAVGPPKDDYNGYTVLDIVFTCQDKAELVVTPYEIVDATGNVIKGNTYSVRTFDKAGKAYECKIVPKKSSDKNLIAMLLG